MGHCLVVATEDGEKENAPCKIGITDAEDQIQNTFDMMARGEGRTNNLKPVAAFTLMHMHGSLDWLGENIATSVTVNQTANVVIERFDNDTRFSRCEELKQMFEDYTSSGLPEMPDIIKNTSPYRMLDLIQEM